VIQATLTTLLLLGLSLAPAQPPEDSLEEAVVAVVGDSVITRFDLSMAMTPEVASMDPLLSASAREEEFARLQRATLQNLVDNELVLAAARQQSLEVSDLEVDEALGRMIPDASTDTEALDQQARTMGFEGATHLRTHVRKKLLMDRVVMMQVRSKIRIGDLELAREFDKRFPGGRFRSLEVAHILFKVSPDDTLEDYRRTWTRASQLQARLAAGELTFEAAAASFSEDSGSAGEGGVLGFVAEGTLEPEFEAAVFALKAGELSKPVRSGLGIHIIKALAEEYRPFADDEAREDARLRLRGVMEEQLFEKAFRRWLDTLRRKVRVDIRL
jgi:peptidyl-prolyl cis-trans isomerase SurA